MASRSRSRSRRRTYSISPYSISPSSEHDNSPGDGDRPGDEDQWRFETPLDTPITKFNTDAPLLTKNTPTSSPPTLTPTSSAPTYKPALAKDDIKMDPKQTHKTGLTYEDWNKLVEKTVYPHQKTANTSSPSDVEKLTFEKIRRFSKPVVTSALPIIRAVLEDAKTINIVYSENLSAVHNRFYRDSTVEALVTRLLGSRVSTYYLNRNDWHDVRLSPIDGTSVVTYNQAIKEKLNEFLIPEEGALASLLGMRFFAQVFNKGDRYNCGVKSANTEHADFALVYGLVGARLETHSDTANSSPDRRILGIAEKLNFIDEACARELEKLSIKLGVASKIDDVAYARYVARSYCVLMNCLSDLSTASDLSELIGAKQFVVRIVDIGLGEWGKSYTNGEEAYRHGLALALRDGLTSTRIKRIELLRGGNPNVAFEPKILQMIKDAAKNSSVEIVFDSKVAHLAPVESKEFLAVTFAWDGTHTLITHTPITHSSHTLITHSSYTHSSRTLITHRYEPAGKRVLGGEFGWLLRPGPRLCHVYTIHVH